MSLLLSDKEIKEALPDLCVCGIEDCRILVNAQAKHTLEWLEKGQLLKHSHSPNIVNVKPCRACAKLREVGA